MNQLTKFTEWFYFHPIFNEAEVESSGHIGLLKSGANLAVWAGVVGGGAKLAGSNRPWTWAGGFFAAAVLGEIFFGLSGPPNGAHIQLSPQDPNTAAAPKTDPQGIPYNGAPATYERGYGEVANGGFAGSYQGYN